MSKRLPITSLDQIQEGIFYKVSDLKAILQTMGLNYSIFSIMNAESWRCANYGCAKRYYEALDKCTRCGSPIIPPVIFSPRTRGGGKGVGHRRYSGDDLRAIVRVLQES